MSTDTHTLGSVLSDDHARELSRAARMVVTWRTNRNRLIREAHSAGGGVREIARAVGLTHAAIRKIVAKGDTADGN